MKTRKTKINNWDLAHWWFVLYGYEPVPRHGNIGRIAWVLTPDEESRILREGIIDSTLPGAPVQWAEFLLNNRCSVLQVKRVRTPDEETRLCSLQRIVTGLRDQMECDPKFRPANWLIAQAGDYIALLSRQTPGLTPRSITPAESEEMQTMYGLVAMLREVAEADDRPIPVQPVIEPEPIPVQHEPEPPSTILTRFHGPAELLVWIVQYFVDKIRRLSHKSCHVGITVSEQQEMLDLNALTGPVEHKLRESCDDLELIESIEELRGVLCVHQQAMARKNPKSPADFDALRNLDDTLMVIREFTEAWTETVAADAPETSESPAQVNVA